MLGDKLGVLSGKVIGQRVLPSEHEPTAETSFEVSGQLDGVQVTMMGTYWSKVRPDGSLYGECPNQGVFIAPDGVGTWTAAGVGWFTGVGTGVSFRGAVYLTKAPASLAKLTSVALIFEWDVDGDSNATGTFWAWK
jgi:hypothetical protein